MIGMTILTAQIIILSCLATPIDRAQKRVDEACKAVAPDELVNLKKEIRLRLESGLSKGALFREQQARLKEEKITKEWLTCYKRVTQVEILMLKEKKEQEQAKELQEIRDSLTEDERKWVTIGKQLLQEKLENAETWLRGLKKREKNPNKIHYRNQLGSLKQQMHDRKIALTRQIKQAELNLKNIQAGPIRVTMDGRNLGDIGYIKGFPMLAIMLEDDFVMNVYGSRPVTFSTAKYRLISKKGTIDFSNTGTGDVIPYQGPWKVLRTETRSRSETIFRVEPIEIDEYKVQRCIYDR